jgi:hypothetical protein
MDYATLIIAIVSLLVSGWTAWKAGALQRHDILMGRRLEVHTLLQDADKVLLDHPTLLRAFRSSESYESVSTWSPADRDMLDRTVLVYLNVFEAAHSVFAETSHLDANEKGIRQAWARSAAQFFDDCPAALNTWTRYRATYYNEFRAFMDSALEALAPAASEPSKISSGDGPGRDLPPYRPDDEPLDGLGREKQASE